MKALSWHGKKDIRCDTVPDPNIEHPRDAIIKVTTCAICGSDLHLFDGFMPGMESGDIMGHEFMGEVVEVGQRQQGSSRSATALSCRSRSSAASATNASAAISRSASAATATRMLADKVFGHTTAGLFGYTHLTGGYPGGQAEYVRVPFADKTPRQDSRRPHATSRCCFSATSFRPAGRRPCSATSSRPIPSRSGARARSGRWPSAARSCSARSRWS